MNFIYHDNQLLGTQLTEWPKKPTAHSNGEIDSIEMHEYEKQLAAALAQSFPVVQEDWQEVKSKILGYFFDEDSGYWFNKDHTDMKSQLPYLEKDTLYSLDIEMEEVERAKVNNEWLEVNRINESKSNFIEYRTALRIKKEEPTQQKILIENQEPQLTATTNPPSAPPPLFTIHQIQIAYCLGIFDGSQKVITIEQLMTWEIHKRKWKRIFKFITDPKNNPL